VRTVSVQFTVLSELRLEGRLHLPAGCYSGIRVDIGRSADGRARMPSRYKITLTPDQLASFGGLVPANLGSGHLDVTDFVTSGAVAVSYPIEAA